jgi:hypothetical protein
VAKAARAVARANARTRSRSDASTSVKGEAMASAGSADWLRGRRMAPFSYWTASAFRHQRPLQWIINVQQNPR